MKEIVAWIFNNISDILAILSILLGGIALIQSWKYNKDSGKIAKDTSFMLVQQVILLNELKKNAITDKSNQNVLNLSKDRIKSVSYTHLTLPTKLEV